MKRSDRENPKIPRQTNPGSGDIIKLVWLDDTDLDKEYVCETLRHSFSLPLLGSLPVSPPGVLSYSTATFSLNPVGSLIFVSWKGISCPDCLLKRLDEVWSLVHRRPRQAREEIRTGWKPPSAGVAGQWGGPSSLSYHTVRL